MNVNEQRNENYLYQTIDLETAIKSENKIHALNNDVNIQNKVAGNKCYMVETIAALYNSPNRRKIIDKLAHIDTKKIYEIKDWK